jgi:hypothetical protein
MLPLAHTAVLARVASDGHFCACTGVGDDARATPSAVASIKEIKKRMFSLRDFTTGPADAGRIV